MDKPAKRARAKKPAKRDVRHFTAVKKDKFLKLIAAGWSCHKAVLKVGISRGTVYNHRESDPAFAKAWDEAYAISTELLEEEAYRRAVYGVKKPVWQGGELMGHIQEYSDTLMVIMLKSRKPEKYRERVSNQYAVENMNILNLNLPPEVLATAGQEQVLELNSVRMTEDEIKELQA
ncbi:MAG: hypothetical protein AMXMBFR84_26160 [Candidatus Hydrogenedentota bacterium]